MGFLGGFLFITFSFSEMALNGFQEWLFSDLVLLLLLLLNAVLGHSDILRWRIMAC